MPRRIHPGYGFLAENAAFARAVTDSGLVFIGPSADAIERMGDKAVARSTMMEAGVPCVPGSDGPVDTVDEALAFAREVGFPVLIKASAGGGGKGMRVAESEDVLEANYIAAKTEAAAAFGNDVVYLEKYLLQTSSHRVPGPCRHPWQRRASLRARLLDPAAPSEAHRGGTLAGADP